MSDNTNTLTGMEIAIIGMAGRFPGAPDLETFWRNLRAGVESIRFPDDAELRALGVDESLLRDPGYVKAASTLAGMQEFDAGFFGYTPREAELMDPQQRLLLECAWEALEDAGYAPQSCADAIGGGSVGVFAGAATNTYLLFNLMSNPRLLATLDPVQIDVNNAADHLATRIAYKLNLTGPAFTVQSACSTSMAALHVACQNLLDEMCDIALAGGVSAHVQHPQGYRYVEGGIVSPDGHCRAFDAQANGTVFGSGVGMVVLRRLEDALKHGDPIRAVILGSAMNNDGALKVGYTAPAVEGQARVIAEALAAADVPAESIGYVEAHGTGTILGDPIEVRALTKAYRATTQARQFCAIGSVKTNIGHLAGAAGISSLIKAALALEHREIPPSLHFTQPNPDIDFAASPFFVNAELRAWEPRQGVRRAGVSSFGVGGANVHAILQEAPAREPSGDSRPAQLLILSARTPAALDAASTNLAAHLRQRPALPLADAAYTLQIGRQPFPRRRIVVAESREEALAALDAGDAQRIFNGHTQVQDRPVAFMFSGQGSQYVGMAEGLYRSEPVFRQHLDACAELLRPHLGLDIRELIYPPEGDSETAAQRLQQTAIAQPVLFAVEFALAQLWMAWGVRPEALIGHSIGEYAAACLAGVFSLEDGLALVAARGRLMQALPPGVMLSVPLPATEVEPLLLPGAALAAANAPALTVASGPEETMIKLEIALAEFGVTAQRLHTSHAFHSAMMDPILEAFTAEVRKVALRPPQIPCVSNLTGTWLRDDEATDPAYWAQHLRRTIRFSDGIKTLLENPLRQLLEVGPGVSLTRLAQPHIAPAQKTPGASTPLPLASVRHPQASQSDESFLLTTLGKLWLAGASVDWAGFHAGERRRRVALPTYPFERQRYWIEPGAGAAAAPSLSRRADPDTWLYAPVLHSAPPLPPYNPAALEGAWWIFADASGLGAALAAQLRAIGGQVTTVVPGDGFAALGADAYRLDPRRGEDYAALLAAAGAPRRVVHLWSFTPEQTPGTDGQRRLELGLYSLLYLARTLVGLARIDWVTDHLHAVTASELPDPEKSLAPGLGRVIPQEYPALTFHCIDADAATTAVLLLNDLAAPPDAPEAAYRGGQRWLPGFAPARFVEPATQLRRLREDGVYAIVGAPEGLGLALARFLPGLQRRVAVIAPQSALSAVTLPDRVLAVPAEWSDAVQMRAALTQVAERFGALHGVLYAASAGDDDIFHPIAETGVEVCRRHLDPKVDGVYALREALQSLAGQGIALDFCLLNGSLSSVMGGYGLAAYAAANRFMSAFAQRQNASSAYPWLCVEWDAWNFDAGAAGVLAVSHDLAGFALSETEGMATLCRILAVSTVARVAVSTGELEARIAHSARRDAPVLAAAQTAYARPELHSDYVAPRNDLERQIAGIWQQVLGIADIGVNDDFFDLGGHSLLATQLRNQIYEKFKVDLPIRSLFDNATVAGIAGLIAKEIEKTAAKPDVPIAERIRAAFPTERPSVLEAYLRTKVAQGLAVAESELPQDGDLRAYNLELVAVDLIWHLKNDLKLQFYPHEITGRPSLPDLARFILAEKERMGNLAALATTTPLAAYTLKPYRKSTRGAAVAPTGKNPGMVFLHSAPRAGSTLLRVMLAGHEKLFCPPELNLLFFDTMREWRENLGFGHDFQWTAQGLHWAFVELMGLETQAGWAYLDKLVAENRTAQSVYGQLQELAGGRLLVDKTPPYALDMDALKRAEAMFDRPRYIFLIRHPYAVMDSLLRARFDRLFAPSLFSNPDVDPYVVTEVVWALCYRNLLDFFAQVDADRVFKLYYEDMVREPADTMRALGEFLGVPFDEALLTPYDGRRERMMGGLGDPNILAHQKIDPELADAWKKVKLPRPLDASTQQLARELGYTLPEDAVAPPSLDAAQPQTEAQLLANLDALSDEEVQALLDKMLSG